MDYMSAVFYREAEHQYPIAVRASGMYIFDEMDKKYLDMCGGAAVSCLGHQHPDVIAALQGQIGTMSFAHTTFFSNEPQEKLATALASRFGEEGAKVYFSSGGSEANETALKLVWQYWRALGLEGKTKIISREHSYHGNTLGALSVSGHPGRRKPMMGVLHDWPRIMPCYAFRDMVEGESEVDYGLRAAKALEDAILKAGPDTVAAFIAEPVVGASLGIVPAVEGYFAEIRAICDRYDILLISDEIMCGTGRTGTFFAHEQDDFLPDIVTLAKGIGGGYQPLAATIVRRKIADAFSSSGQAFNHGHTYIGHASACASGMAVLDTFDKYQLLGNVRAKGTALIDALRSNFAGHANVGDIRGRGLFIGVEIVADKATNAMPEDGAGLAKKILKSAMGHGLLCYPNGGSAESGSGCHVMFAPPFILDDSHIAEMIEKFHKVMVEVFGG